MREVKLSDGRAVTVRALKRGEVRKLEPLGINAASFNVPRESFTQVLDGVLATQVDDIDALSMPDCRALFFGILPETYSDKAEEKNSLPSGPSDQTASDETTAPIA